MKVDIYLHLVDINNHDSYEEKITQFSFRNVTEIDYGVIFGGCKKENIIIKSDIHKHGSRVIYNLDQIVRIKITQEIKKCKRF